MTDTKIRWGLISTARINERLIPAIRQATRSELVGVASRDQAKAERYAQQWNIPCAYGSYEAMLADPQIDAVYIPLPNGYHAEWAIKSADAGKHILCEKPLAITVDEVDRMAEAARRNNVTLQEAAMYRYHPQTRQIQALVTQGAIGDIRLIRSVFGFTLMNPGDVRLDPAIGGGALWDLGSYPVSYMRTLLREEPTDVAAWQTTGETDVDMTLMGQLRFPSGAFGQFTCSFQMIPYWDMEIIGSQGRIFLQEPWLNRIGETSNVRVIRPSGKAQATFGDDTSHLKEETLTDPGTNAYVCEVQSMESCILDGASPVIPLESSRGNVAAIVALLTAAKENRVVTL
ncbi:MAG: Gfo/Idh/MocA family oxidoreductase [Anaerolineae bacterium]|nr:Gfo/Idh/MocA family oxidoreductase [Anaerolineae bacterium]